MRNKRDDFTALVMKLCKEKGIKGESFTVDMTGGGRPYEKWTKRERKQAIDALLNPYGEYRYSGRVVYGFHERKLPKRHPYFSLNDIGKGHASISAFLERLHEYERESRKVHIMVG